MSKRPGAPQGITQAELVKYQQFQADLAELEKQFDQLKGVMIVKLLAGAPIQDGELTADLETTHPKYPAWKDAYVKALGQTSADEIIAATEESTVNKIHVHRRSRFQT